MMKWEKVMYQLNQGNKPRFGEGIWFGISIHEHLPGAFAFCFIIDSILHSQKKQILWAREP